MTITMEKVTLEGHNDRIWDVCWSPSGNLLATCGGDRTVRLWRQNSDGKWDCVDKLEGAHRRTVRRCKFSNCETLIATVSFDATTCIWDKKYEDQWELEVTLEGHESEVKDVVWSPDGELLATCGRDKSIWIWLKEEDEQFECLDVLQGHSQDVKALTWVPNSRALVSASYDNTIKVWNEISEEWICTQTLDGSYQGHEDTVWDLVCSPDGKMLLSCDNTGMLLLWDIIFSEQKYELKLHSRNQTNNKKAIYSIDWSSSGIIAAACTDNSVSLLKCVKEEEGECAILKLSKEIEQAHLSDVNCIAFHPKNPNVLASGGDDELVHIWNLSGNDSYIF